MARRGWHILREEGALVLTRRLPPRLDVSAETLLPDGRKAALAHQVRQDLWRALRDLRGFSPVVRVEAAGTGLRVIAGGRVAGPVPDGTGARIAALLESPAHRARWVAQARRRADA